MLVSVVADEPYTTTTLARETARMLQQDRLHDALGIYWLAGACECRESPGDQTNVVAAPTGRRAVLLMHFCRFCGRPPSNDRERVLGAAPWDAGDMAVLDGDLVMLLGAPGPTGDLRVAKMDEPGVPISTHVALLNLED